MKSSASTFQIFLGILLILISCKNDLLAQDDLWFDNGDSIVYTNRLVGIGTDTPTGNLEIKGLLIVDSLDVKGLLSVDGAKINGFLTADSQNISGLFTAGSMHCHGLLRVGDSTLVFQNDANGLLWGATPGLLSDHIRSTRGRIIFFNEDTEDALNIRIGISQHDPIFKFHVFGDGGSPFPQAFRLSGKNLQACGLHRGANPLHY